MERSSKADVRVATPAHARSPFRRVDRLAFLYQERKASGEDSTFFKLVNR
jgi:hypothetical protein